MTKTKGNLLIATAAILAAGALTNPAAACVDKGEVYLGTVCIMANSYCPEGYTEPNGQLLAISQYAALFSLMGTAWGGDGTTSFGLPNLKSRSPMHLGIGVGLSPVAMGQYVGAETDTVLVPVPEHSHLAAFTPGGGGSPIEVEVAIPVVGGTTAATTNTPGPTVNLAQPEVSTTGFDTITIESYSAAATNTTLEPFDATVTGGGGSGTVTVGNTGTPNATITVETRAPALGIRFCIAIEGLYPPHP